MRRTAVLLVLCLCGLSACNGDSGASSVSGGRRVRVVAAFYPLYEVASRVGGNRAAVTNLTAAGAEPHDLELSSKQVDRVEAADVIVYLGKGFQPAVEDAAKRAKGERVDLLSGLNLLPGDEEGAGGDPHVWLDPGRMRQIVQRVRGALVKADAQDTAKFDANATSYEAELAALDTEFEQGLANCARRTIVTSHAAFGYLSGHYGLDQVAIAGVSPEVEPNPKRLAQLADLVQAKGVTTIFTETLVSSKVADTLAREAGAKTDVLNPLEGLTKDQIRQGKSYLTVMRDNLQRLRSALACA